MSETTKQARPLEVAGWVFTAFGAWLAGCGSVAGVGMLGKLADGMRALNGHGFAELEHGFYLWFACMFCDSVVLWLAVIAGGILMIAGSNIASRSR